MSTRLAAWQCAGGGGDGDDAVWFLPAAEPRLRRNDPRPAAGVRDGRLVRALPHRHAAEGKSPAN